MDEGHSIAQLSPLKLTKKRKRTKTKTKKRKPIQEEEDPGNARALTRAPDNQEHPILQEEEDPEMPEL